MKDIFHVDESFHARYSALDRTYRYIILNQKYPSTHLLDNGADLNSVKDLLGHTSLAATQIYTNRSIEEIKKVFKKTHPRNK